MKTFNISVDSENFDKPEIIITVTGYCISEHETLEIQYGWNVGEPINDPCDSETVYLANSGCISDTIKVLEKFGFKEI